MKKVFLSLALVLVAFAAAAQNSAIDALAGKYDGKEGFTVVNIGGDMLKALADQTAAKANTEIKAQIDGANLDLKKVTEGLEKVTVIVAETPHAGFARDIKRAIDGGKYQTLLTHDADGTSVKIVYADTKKKDVKELVISVVDEGNSHVLARAILKIDPETLAALAETAKNAL